MAPKTNRNLGLNLLFRWTERYLTFTKTAVDIVCFLSYLGN